MGSIISVVIVSLDGKQFLGPCLASLVAGERVPEEIIVVDNGSTDGTAAWLAETYPSVRCLSQAVNLGFAAANNAGFAAAQGDLIFALNNDTELMPDSLAALVDALDRAGDRNGAAMATMVFAHRPEIIACAGIEVYENGVALEARMGDAYCAEDPPLPVFGPSAGAALYRRTALDDVGCFDPAFFAYLEDADLAWRLRLRRWGTIAVPPARVRHVYSGTAGFGSPRKAYYLARNRWWCIGKNIPDGLLRRFRPAIAAYDAASLAFALAAGDRASIAGRFAALHDREEIVQARSHVQSRATATDDEIATWIKPAPDPRTLLIQRRKLAALMQPVQ